MTKNEFIQLTGIEVTDEEFKTINDMYMSAGDDFDKQRFCDDWKQNGESTLMYRFYKLFEDAQEKLKNAQSDLEKLQSDLATANANADMYKSWWNDESEKTEKAKEEFNGRIIEMQREFTAFKDKSLDAIKFIASQL
ncbi:MAG: hypothetical protein Q4D30_01145 [Bacteroidales bacterium]|nr:hypothetical protein [Bacteroidales bacterium]